MGSCELSDAFSNSRDIRTEQDLLALVEKEDLGKLRGSVGDSETWQSSPGVGAQGATHHSLGWGHSSRRHLVV